MVYVGRENEMLRRESHDDSGDRRNVLLRPCVCGLFLRNENRKEKCTMTRCM